MQAAGPDPWPGGCGSGGGDTMNALAANECRTVSRPPESMQRDAIVQSLPDYPPQQGQDSRITRGVPCHDLPQDPPVRDHHPGQLTGHATPCRLNLTAASRHRRRHVTCRPSPLPRPVRQQSKLPGPGLAPGGEPPGPGTGDRRALPARGSPHTRRCRPAGRDPLAPASPGEGEQIADVLGILEENDPASFAVRTCDGALVVIPAARALAGKVVPPASQNRRRAGPAPL